MTSERALRGIVGVFVLGSVTLSIVHSRNWLYFTGFVGFMLLQSSLTDWCPLLLILEKSGLPRCRPAPALPVRGR
jgi:Inner membrane protein YgaP-like, transmembrane domain